MARTKAGETTIQLVVPLEGKKALEKMMEVEELPSVSELIRRLLNNYCQDNGIDVDFTVGGWGGRRTTLKSQEADEGLQPVEVKRDNALLTVKLADGRIIAHPIAWYAWLQAATDEQFADMQTNPLMIYWPKLEEGLSIDTLLKGPPTKK